MNNPNWLLYWRLSATATLTNQNLFALGLPPVNTASYLAYSKIQPQSQGGATRQGYINLSLLWDSLDFFQLKTLTGIVDAALTAGAIYGTAAKDNGTGLLNAFVDYHGKPVPVTYQPISNARGVSYVNVTLKINNLTITADPSAVI